MFKRTKPLVSIIIPSWFTENQHGSYGENETYNIASKCLERLINVTPREKYELIIIDNGSTLTDKKLFKNELSLNNIRELEQIEKDKYDINTGMCQSMVSSTKTYEDYLIMTLERYWNYADILIRNKENLGFAPACNQGFKLARGEYIFCMNNDIAVWDGWMDAILQSFNKNMTPPIGIIMPNLIKSNFQKNCLRANGKLDNVKAMQLKKEDIMLPNKDELEIGAEFGSLFAMHRNIYDKLIEKDGYIYDENFRLGFGEDRDLWDRVRLLGYQTYRTNATRVLHFGNMSMSKFPNRKIYTEKNREYLADKRKQRE